MSSQASIIITPQAQKAFSKALGLIAKRKKAGMLLLAQSASLQMEGYAKRSARWTDRTGNARQRLKGEARWLNATKLKVSVTHNMDYGIWLELANERKYAILKESIDYKAEELLKACKELEN